MSTFVSEFENKKSNYTRGYDEQLNISNPIKTNKEYYK